MRTYDLTRVGDANLMHILEALVARARLDTAAIVAHIAEVDARRLYSPAGYPSRFAYCVGRLRLSEDAAYKRIQAARAARRFPAIFEALADGRLHLAAAGLLSPHLTPENADGLLAAATHKTREDIERMLAERFPRAEILSLVQGIPAAPPAQLVPGRVESPQSAEELTGQLAPGQVEACECGEEFPGQLAPGPVEVIAQRSRVRPLSPMSFALQFTIAKSTHDKLRYAQELLSHRLPAGDIAQVFDRALDALVGQLEKRKFAAASKPRSRSSRPSGRARHIPAHVKRAVWQRDRGQCTFVGEQGQRCRSRQFLETSWNDGPTVVTSSCLREEKPTVVARGHRDRGLAPVAPEPHTRGARREHERYHLRRDGRTQEGDQRGDAVARAQRAGRVAAGQRAGRDSATGEEAPARGAG